MCFYILFVQNDNKRVFECALQMLSSSGASGLVTDRLTSTLRSVSKISIFEFSTRESQIRTN